MVVPPPQAAPQQPTGTVAKRRKVASVTIMPEAKTRAGETMATRIPDPAALVMVQAGILQMKPPGLLTRWKAQKKVTKAIYASELSSKNHAHWQGWHQWLTEQPQSEVPEQLLEAVRNASGKRKTEQLNEPNSGKLAPIVAATIVTACRTRARACFQTTGQLRTDADADR